MSARSVYGLLILFSYSTFDHFVTAAINPYHLTFNQSCQLSDSLIQEIANYSKVVQIIFDHVLNNDTHQTYNKLAYFVDTFGPRPTGSQALENSIDYLVQEMTVAGLENIHTEEVAVDHWERGEESLYMVTPRVKKMGILGLGGSVGTPHGGIVGEVVVVDSFEHLEAKSNETEGKIVLYVFDHVDYANSYMYRTKGAVEAAKRGAIAALVRSVTDFSLYTLHTGSQHYVENVTKIPVASITVEDAELLKRISERGQKIFVHLKMFETEHPPNTSRNTVGELQGAINPEQVVIIGGHVDSWDVGQGAMDDGGGVYISWRALQILKELGLRPKRTLRSVLWTAEEVGLVGAKAYYSAHKAEQENISIALESDFGTFNPVGLALWANNNQTKCIVQEVLKLFSHVNMSTLVLTLQAPDLNIWKTLGVPIGGLLNDNDRYFHYHHTKADTMAAMDKGALDRCLAFWTTISYIFADLNDMLPR